MTELERSIFLEFCDEWAARTRKVQRATGMSRSAIEKAMKNGEFPLPVMEMNGMPYWRLGDLVRHDLGWA
ncbi:AlpA family transcriptional regulator [Tropicimonas sp. IMCC6043]|uniref:helix-turn-helix transcriptional regulator n=1 Tax=Tropicimonas sp. IMCC6043 TaxID=2510645 RepID=UPI00101CC0CC|nr:AlpA family phage regulatory protein [Tropicimonas sp. IMCC6043]RYH06239.1 AlpA family phage regulatory protein [Tropicimonas sp. IMCC6043]